jgi:hypothetical protein
MKRARIFLVAFSSIFVLLVTVFFYVKFRHTDNAKQPMPSFEFFTLASERFTQDSIGTHFQLVAINHFQPDCHFCEDFVVKMIQSKKHISPNNLLLMVSSAKKAALTSFIDKYPISKMPGVIVLQDSLHKFNHYFGQGGVPTTFLYDAERHLLKRFSGEFPFERLTKDHE